MDGDGDSGSSVVHARNPAVLQDLVGQRGVIEDRLTTDVKRSMVFETSVVQVSVTQTVRRVTPHGATRRCSYQLIKEGALDFEIHEMTTLRDIVATPGTPPEIMLVGVTIYMTMLVL